MEVEKKEQENMKQGELQQEFIKVEKEIEEKAPKNKKRIFLIVFCILIGWWCMNTIRIRFDRLEERINSVNMRLNEIDNHDVANEVRSVLEKQAAVLTSSDWDIKMLNKEIKKVDLMMSVVPKEYVEGMIVTFYAECSDGTKISVKGEQTDSMKFAGKVEIPFCDSVDMRVTLKKGEVTQIEEIGSSSVKDRFVMDLDADWSGQYGYRGGVVNTEGRVEVELFSKYEETPRKMKKLDLVVYVADKEWKRLPVENEDEEAPYFENIFSVDMNETIPIEAGEALRMTIEGEDEYGFHYRNVVMQTRFKENGESTEEWHFMPETEVY